MSSFYLILNIYMNVLMRLISPEPSPFPSFPVSVLNGEVYLQRPNLELLSSCILFIHLNSLWNKNKEYCALKNQRWANQVQLVLVSVFPKNRSAHGRKCGSLVRPRELSRRRLHGALLFLGRSEGEAVYTERIKVEISIMHYSSIGPN